MSPRQITRVYVTRR